MGGLPHQLADSHSRIVGDRLVCSNAHLDFLIDVSHGDWSSAFRRARLTGLEYGFSSERVAHQKKWDNLGRPHALGISPGAFAECVSNLRVPSSRPSVSLRFRDLHGPVIAPVSYTH